MATSLLTRESVRGIVPRGWLVRQRPGGVEMTGDPVVPRSGEDRQRDRTAALVDAGCLRTAVGQSRTPWVEAAAVGDPRWVRDLTAEDHRFDALDLRDHREQRMRVRV